jgi:hypothetical protein
LSSITVGYCQRHLRSSLGRQKIMAADNNSVNSGPTHGAGQLKEMSPLIPVPEHVEPGTTWSEFIAKVDDLRMPGDGFAGAIEAVQANQGLAEMPEWPD